MQCLLKNLCKAGSRMKKITLFLSFCWILWFSQIFAISTMFSGIHDMPVNPSVITLSESQPEFLIDLDGDDLDRENDLTANENENKTTDYRNEQNTLASAADESIKVNDFVLLSETKKSLILSNEESPDEQSQKINDSAATTNDLHIETEDEASVNIELDELAIKSNIPASSNTAEVNLTIEEHPIPVFSEWAQKQMEEAEKQLEKQVVNSSTMKRNATNGNKPQMLKIRSKNYGSPDCGAKIIASNNEAENTGALLTSSRDEYMLSPCTNRIWFVVELCEAIQAKQIELANFELFSSSPKNFTVAVSNRYPTREWSNVGRFIADDSRNIQSFELHPHLFGKFVRVDIHSHYSSEHFCPISLFRVYGTSEFEAFETENRNPDDDIDDVDDDIGLTGIDLGEGVGANGDEINAKADNKDSNVKKGNQNLFKSASDAVMSIVKKAAQVLVKDNTNQNSNDKDQERNELCFSPKFPNFECTKCHTMFVANVNNLLACKFKYLVHLLGLGILRSHLIKSRLCSNRFEIENIPSTLSSSIKHQSLSQIDVEGCATNEDQINQQKWPVSISFKEHHSYFLSIIPLDYLAAMCHVLSQSTLPTNNHNNNNDIYHDDRNDPGLNLTIDEKSSVDDKTVEFIDPKNLVNNSDNQLRKKLNEQRMQNLDINKENIIGDSSVNNNSDEDLKKNQNEISDTNLNQKTIPRSSHPLSNNEKVLNMDKEAVINSESVNIFNLVDTFDKNEEISELQNSDNHNILVDNNEETEETFKANSNENIIKIEDTLLSSQSMVTPTPQSTAIPLIRSNNIEVDVQSWDSIDTLLSEQISGESTGSVNNVGGGTTVGSSYPGGYQSSQPKTGYHSESVFVRLSNRIKALERNMSLSGQYLEELSRRYKKQVEELQNSFAKSLTAIEEQSRRAVLMEQFLMEQNINLKENLKDLSQQFYFWISILLCVTVVVLIHVLISWYSVSSMGRKQGKFIQKYEENTNNYDHRTSLRKLRRNSVEGVSGHPTPIHKTRRPSEEAMRISGSYKDLMISDDEDDDSIININGFNDDISLKNQTSSTYNSDIISSTSWSKCKVVPAISPSNTSTQLTEQRKRKPSVFCLKDNQSSGFSNSIDKYSKIIISPHNELNTGYPQLNQQTGIPEELLIVDEDYESFIPGTDLVYNEFMPEGPSGENICAPKMNGGLFSSKKPSKFRRLSSPGFLKSTFSKSSSSSNSSNGSKKKIPSTEATSWEWYRLKKTTVDINSISKILPTSSPIEEQQHQQNPNDNIISNKKNSFIPTLIENSNGTSDSNGSTDKNISSNSSEFIILNNNGSNCSESDSLRTTHSEEISISSGNDVNTSSNCIKNGNGIYDLHGITNGNLNQIANKRNSKKQRSIKKILKKVF